MVDVAKYTEEEAGLTQSQLDEGMIGAMRDDIADSAAIVISRMRAPGEGQVLSDELHGELGEHKTDFRVRILETLAGTTTAPETSRVFRLIDRPVHERLVLQAREAIAAQDRVAGVAPIVGVAPKWAGNLIQHSTALIADRGVMGALRFIMSNEGMRDAPLASKIDPGERRVLAEAERLAAAFDPIGNPAHKQIMMEEMGRLAPQDNVFSIQELEDWRTDASRVIPGTTTTLQTRLESMIGDKNLNDPSVLALTSFLRGQEKALARLDVQLGELYTSVEGAFPVGDANRDPILDALLDATLAYDAARTSQKTPNATNTKALKAARANVEARMPILPPANVRALAPAQLALYNQAVSSVSSVLLEPLERLQAVFNTETGADVGKAEADAKLISTITLAERARMKSGDDAYKEAFKENAKYATAGKALGSIKDDLSKLVLAQERVRSITNDINHGGLPTTPPKGDTKDPAYRRYLELSKERATKQSSIPSLDLKLKGSWRRYMTLYVTPYSALTPPAASPFECTQISRLSTATGSTDPDFPTATQDTVLDIEARGSELVRLGEADKEDLDERKKEWEAFKKLSYDDMKVTLGLEKRRVKGKAATPPKIVPGTHLLPDGFMLKSPSKKIGDESISSLEQLEERYKEANSTLKKARTGSSGASLRKNPLPAEMLLYKLQLEDPAFAKKTEGEKEFRAALRTLLQLDSVSSKVNEGATVRRAQTIVSSRLGRMWKSGNYRPFAEIQSETFDRDERLKGTTGFSLSTGVDAITKKVTSGALTVENLAIYIFQLEQLAQDKMEGGNLLLGEDPRQLIHNCKVVYYSNKARQIVKEMGGKKGSTDKAEVLKKLMDEAFELPEGVSALKVLSRSEVSGRSKLEGARTAADAETDATGKAHEKLAAIEKWGSLATLVLGAKGMGSIMGTVGKFIGSWVEKKPKQLNPPK
jgi:hypothetical protein